MTDPATTPERAPERLALCDRVALHGKVMYIGKESVDVRFDSGIRLTFRPDELTLIERAGSRPAAVSTGTADGNRLPSGISWTALRQAAELDQYADGAPLGFVRNGEDMRAILACLDAAEAALAARDTEVAQLRAQLAATWQAGETWLKTYRDNLPGGRFTNPWHAIDGALNDYRLHMHTGTPLDQHVCEGGCHPGTCPEAS